MRHVLLVDDNPADANLVEEALEGRVELHVASSGPAALEFLRGQTVPVALVLLDLNLPQLDGREVLAAIKGDPRLKSIPVVVLTTSKSEDDVTRAYELGANCYLTKRGDLAGFLTVVRAIETFWLTMAALPPPPRRS